MARNIRVAMIGAGIGGLAAAGALRQRGIRGRGCTSGRRSSARSAPASSSVPTRSRCCARSASSSRCGTLACEPANFVRSPGTTRICGSASRSRRRHGAIRRALSDGAPRRPAWPAVRPVAGRQRPARRALHRRASPPGRRWRRLPTAHEIEADVVVGADGINSTVRESLFGAQPVRFTQQMAWRCIVPIDACRPGSGVDRPRRICRLDRPGRSCDLLSDPWRRAVQHLRRPRHPTNGWRNPGRCRAASTNC